MTGPRWVCDATQQVKGMFHTVIQCIGDGTDIDESISIEGAECIEEAGIADMRFALFSSLGIALQDDIDAAIAMLRKKTTEAQQTGLWENASSLLACCLFALDNKDHPSQMVMVGARSSWVKWMQWGAHLWSGMSSQVYNMDSINKRIDGRVQHFVIGDELGMNILGASSSNTMVCLLNEQQPKVEEATDLTFAIWEMSHRMSNALLTYTQRNALPLCICEVPKMTSVELLGLSIGWVRSALILNALRGVDPLTMWGADQWRMIEESVD